MFPVGIVSLLFPLLMAVACGDRSQSEQAIESASNDPLKNPTLNSPTPAKSEIIKAELWAAADRRAANAQIATAAKDSDSQTRAAAMTAFSRLREPEHIPKLIAGLRDSDAQVRGQAALGLGALGELANDHAQQALLGSVATETNDDVRSEMLWDLGRIGTRNALDALTMGMNEDHLRAGACRGVAELGTRRMAIPEALLGLVATAAFSSNRVETRRACTFALSRFPTLAAAHQASLEHALRDEDATVRRMALRVLEKVPNANVEVIEARCDDPDWQVAVQAFRTLKKHVEANRYVSALERRLARATAPDSLLEGGELHVLLTALQLPRTMADNELVHHAAQNALRTLSQIPEGVPLRRDRGLAHCAAAKLVDLGRGWPSRLETCGLEQVEDWERQVMAAQVLGEVDRDDRQRIHYLQQLVSRETPAVTQAALRAVAEIEHPLAVEMILSGLVDQDLGIVAQSCDVLSRAYPKWSTIDGLAPTHAQLEHALQKARSTVGSDLEGIQAWTKAVAAVPLEQWRSKVVELLEHHNPAVREEARTALAALTRRQGRDQPISSTERRQTVPNPIPPLAMDALPETVMLNTTRGSITIRLETELAPTTVARFTTLVRDGFYDGLRFHRVVPAFVVQAGDPRGDGYGGPGWSQRCEDNRISYQRGTVGMALAGRDTGGSQFFITHSEQPHLDGRYTAFGKVEQGMNIVDTIQAGDEIIRAYIR